MILICGGAGYIGSHAVKMLLDRGEEVVVIDNLETGFREAVDGRARFEVADLRDEASIKSVFENYTIEEVVHFSANSLVGESMVDPIKYFENNVGGAINLVKVMKAYDVKKIVFSSTAAVYGEPENIPIIETDAKEPTNPYGESKLMMEKIFKWADSAYGIRFMSLRYFNVAGAVKSGEIGESHDPETHLIPLVLQVPRDLREKVMIYGDDYETRDGTCIRDYIHVLDLVEAHILALDRLRGGQDSDIFNLGSGEGFSVKEIVEKSREVTGHNIPAEVSDRRAGDPAILIASSDKARKVLNWQPKHTNVEEIIHDAWQWHQKNPMGFGRP